MKQYLFLLIIVLSNLNFSSLRGQEDKNAKCLYIRPKALDAGIYDWKKGKAKPYTILDEVASFEIVKNILAKDSTQNLSNLGASRNENGEIEYELDFNYCPEYHIAIVTTTCNVEIYDFKTKKRLHCDPSTYVYSPSGKYRFGYFGYDECRYYLEEKINDEYEIKGYIKNNISLCHYYKVDRFYWFDDETIYFLREKERTDGTKYQIAYSTKFYNEPIGYE